LKWQNGHCKLQFPLAGMKEFRNKESNIFGGKARIIPKKSSGNIPLIVFSKNGLRKFLNLPMTRN
jgi:hypothetical protein